VGVAGSGMAGDNFGPTAPAQGPPQAGGTRGEGLQVSLAPAMQLSYGVGPTSAEPEGAGSQIVPHLFMRPVIGVTSGSVVCVITA
jgi:hypothetical protein